MADVGAWSQRGKVPPANGASKAFAGQTKGSDIYLGTIRPNSPKVDRGKINKLRKQGENRPKAAQNVV